MALTVIACYDISDDDRRAKVAARLQRHGDRLQYSIFLCTLDAAELSALETEVKQLLDLDEDSFFVVRQCSRCWGDRISIGQAHPPTPTLFWSVF